MSAIRTRWAAIGAALAVSLGAGGLGVVQAVVDDGPKPIFVPINPCRVLDTRDYGGFNVGPRDTPIGADETLDVQAAGGTNGECSDVPASAVGLVMNVTLTDPTAATHVSIWPSDEVRPNASNLNTRAGATAVPNLVTTDLSAGGMFSVYNFQGTVNVLADVVGYYEDHNHDDRYYTENEVDDLLSQYLTETEINQLIEDAKLGDVDLSDYLTESEINALIADFLTEAEINALLGDFLTEAEINALLGDFLTEAEINALLADFLTEAEINALVTTVLADYYTAAEVDVLIENFITEADLPSFLTGDGPPSDTLGIDGDVYFDTTGRVLYGPKTGGSWPLPGTPLGGGSIGGQTRTGDLPLITLLTFEPLDLDDEITSFGTGITYDAAADQFTVAETGVYRVSYTANVTAGLLGTTFQVRINGTPQGSPLSVATLGGSVSDTLLLDVNAGDVVDLAIGGVANLALAGDANFTIERVA